MAVWLIRGVDGPQEEIFIKSKSIGIHFGVNGAARILDDVLKQEIREFYLCWKPQQARTMKPSALNGVVTRFANQVKVSGMGRKSGTP